MSSLLPDAAIPTGRRPIRVMVRISRRGVFGLVLVVLLTATLAGLVLILLANWKGGA